MERVNTGLPFLVQGDLSGPAPSFTDVGGRWQRGRGRQLRLERAQALALKLDVNPAHGVTIAMFWAKQ